MIWSASLSLTSTDDAAALLEKTAPPDVDAALKSLVVRAVASATKGRAAHVSVSVADGDDVADEAVSKRLSIHVDLV